MVSSAETWWGGASSSRDPPAFRRDRRARRGTSRTRSRGSRASGSWRRRRSFQRKAGSGAGFLAAYDKPHFTISLLRKGQFYAGVERKIPFAQRRRRAMTTYKLWVGCRSRRAAGGGARRRGRLGPHELHLGLLEIEAGVEERDVLAALVDLGGGPVLGVRCGALGLAAEASSWVRMGRVAARRAAAGGRRSRPWQ